MLQHCNITEEDYHVAIHDIFVEHVTILEVEWAEKSHFKGFKWCTEKKKGENYKHRLLYEIYIKNDHLIYYITYTYSCYVKRLPYLYSQKRKSEKIKIK